MVKSFNYFLTQLASDFKTWDASLKSCPAMEEDESLSDRQEYEVEALKAIYDQDFEVGHEPQLIGPVLHMVVTHFVGLHCDVHPEWVVLCLIWSNRQRDATMWDTQEENCPLCFTNSKFSAFIWAQIWERCLLCSRTYATKMFGKSPGHQSLSSKWVWQMLVFKLFASESLVDEERSIGRMFFTLKSFLPSFPPSPFHY